jgi:hypothetical protein
MHQLMPQHRLSPGGGTRAQDDPVAMDKACGTQLSRSFLRRRICMQGEGRGQLCRQTPKPMPRGIGQG